MNLANVIVIDDDAFVRSSLTAALKSYGITVIGTGQDFATALSLCETTPIDVAIIDLDLGPGPSGVQICHSLRQSFPQLGLILLTSYTELKIADPNMPNLPRGTKFLSKSNLSNFQILINNILAAKAKPLAKSNTIPSKSQLTTTQLEVLKMLAEGLTSTEIASRRDVSVKAIEGIISKIHRELGLEKSKIFNQRVQLTRAYFKLTGKNPPGV